MSVRMFAVWILALVLLPSALALPVSRASAQSEAPKSGLDTLSDDVLLGELSQRELNSLLERYFDVKNVPKDQRDAIRAIGAVRLLTSPTSKLTAVQREQVIRDAVRGINAAAPQLNNPRQLMAIASALIGEMERDVNILEYWGPMTGTQARLLPTARATITVLDRAGTVATKLADEAANRIRRPDDEAAKQYDELDMLAQTATYTRANTTYFLALALDPASNERKQLAREAAEYLKQFDVDDNPRRFDDRYMSAKLLLVAQEYAAANTALESIVSDARDDAPLVWNAKYFRAVSDVLSRKPNDAKVKLDELIQWQATNLTSDRIQGATAAVSMLRFRILDQQSLLASDPAVKKKAADEALTELNSLLRSQPGLRSIIFEQLVARLPEGTNLASQEPLLLEALVRRGEDIVLRPPATNGQGQPIAVTDEERKTLSRAVEAADELMRRTSGVERAMLDASSLLRGFFLERLDQPLESATSFLDYVEKFPTDRQRNDLAIQNAASQILKARQRDAADSDVGRQWDRFLPLAVNRFGMNEFAFDLARRQQLNNKLSDAIETFKKVAADDPRHCFAQFFTMLAWSARLESNEPALDRKSALAEIQRLSDVVIACSNKMHSTATDDRSRAQARSIQAGTTLLAAELARREQNDSDRALKLLENIETSVAGLPDEQARLADALLIRVQAYTTKGQLEQAQKQLVSLIERSPERGGQNVYELLVRIDDELEAAESRGDAARIASLARARASLSSFFVNFARNHSNPNVQKLTYGYEVFDAEAQRYAADAETDAQVKKDGLEKALARFNELNTPAAIARFKAQDAARANLQYDPFVILGLGRTYFAMQNYPEARRHFGRLVNDKTIGDASKLVPQQGGGLQEVDNNEYWEVVLRLIQSSVRTNVDIDAAKVFLRQQYIKWDTRVGGTRWKDEFEQLRKELIPEWNPGQIPQ